MSVVTAARAASLQSGFSYIEVLVATVLIATALVPALEALQPGIQASQIHRIQTENRYLLTAKMEDLLAEPFADLDAAAGDASTPTSYSDSVTASGGRQVNRQVYLSRYDGDNADGDDDPFTDTDEGLLWVRVEIAGSPLALETLTSD